MICKHILLFCGLPFAFSTLPSVAPKLFSFDEIIYFSFIASVFDVRCKSLLNPML